MADSHQIDKYFNDIADYNSDKISDKQDISRGMRFIRIGFPCLAALLFGVMVVIPNIRKNVQITDIVTVPKKNEMEQLHVEQTVFNITDAQNRINKIFADNIDEVAPGSQEIKAINPRGVIASDKGDINVRAETGYFNQDTHILVLVEKVKALLNDGTIIKTQKSTYDFDKEIGYGEDKVFAEGNWGQLRADSFRYNRNEQILYLYGSTEIITANGVLTAQKEMRYFEQENKLEAYKDVVVTQKGKNINSERMIAYLSNEEKQDLERAEFYDNVCIKTATEKVCGDYGIYDSLLGKIDMYSSSDKKVVAKQGDNVLQANHITAYLSGKENQEIKRVEAKGDVLVTTPKGTARGDRGYYNPKEDKVMLYDNVIIEQNGNFIQGSYAETDLKTSVSRITGQKAGERVSGIFYNRKKEKE